MKVAVIGLFAFIFANLGQAVPFHHVPKYAPPYSPTSFVWTCTCKGKLMCKDGDRFSAQNCVSSNQVCDGILDCKDGSDEASCPKAFTCPVRHYKCERQDRCIGLNQVCDKKRDCLHGDDEATCAFTCPAGHYKCKREERCIRIDQVCDKKPDCLFGDDEASCAFTCPDGQYKCENQNICIGIDKVCDKKQDCFHGDDEATCVPRCSDGEYVCNGGGECIDAGMVCDGNLDCSDGDDEADCACGNGRYRCNDAKTCLPIAKVCDSNEDCPDRDDELSCASCNDNWSPVATISTTGAVTEGSKTALINAVLAGAEIRVLMPSLNYLTSVQNARKIGDNLCAQALLHISKSGYDRFQANAYWWFLNVCTTGNVDVTRYNVGENQFRGKTTAKWAVKWYIRPMHNMPLMHTSENNVVSGNEEDLISKVKAGSDVRIVSGCDGYAAPMDSLEISTNEEHVVGQSLYHVSQEESSPNYVFQPNAYWWFTNWVSDSNLHITRWTLGEHTNRGDSSLTKQMAWYTESCWQLAYKHDASGNRIKGSLESLRSAVLKGHRVKVIYGETVSVEPDEVIISGGHISAVILRMVKKDPTDPRMFVSGAQWDWRILTSTGAENTLLINVGEYVEQGRTTGTRAVTWFIDKRTWVPVLVNDNSGSVQSGSKPDLIDAVNNAARIRYTLKLSDTPDTIRIYEADNLAIGNNNVGATHVRSVSVERVSGSTTDWKFQENAFFWHTIASTTGKVANSRWTVGEHVPRGLTPSTADMKWFANF